jgi:hypothetical protein
VKTVLRFKPIQQSSTGKFDNHVNYPERYVGQLLGTGYVFISNEYRKILPSKQNSIDDYLTQFANEVAIGKSIRAKLYQDSNHTGQRFLWTFPSDETVLLSLVVQLRRQVRTVMYLGHIRDVCDVPGTLLHHAELCVRQSIETGIGVSTHPSY